MTPRQSPDVCLCTNNDRAGTCQAGLRSSVSLCSVRWQRLDWVKVCSCCGVRAGQRLPFPWCWSFLTLLWCGMICDASAANIGHSVTAGCTSSRVGRCQSWVCGEHIAVSLLCLSSMTFLKPRHTSGTPFTLSPDVLPILNSTHWKTTAKVQPPSNYTNSSESGCGIAASFPHLQVASGMSAWFYLFIITLPLDLSSHF